MKTLFIILAILSGCYLIAYLWEKITGRWIIPVNLHYYQPFLITFPLKRNLKITFRFPKMCWYSNNVPSGWNKMVRIGRLISYADYATIGFQVVDASPGDKHILQGRVMKLAAYWHDDWGIYQYVQFPVTVPWNKKCKALIVRGDNYTEFIVKIEGVDYQIIRDTTIDGQVIWSPYFGGKGRAEYLHSFICRYSTTNKTEIV